MNKQYEHDLSEALLRSQMEAPAPPASKASAPTKAKEKKTMSLGEFHAPAAAPVPAVPSSALLSAEKQLEDLRREADRKAKLVLDMEMRNEEFKKQLKVRRIIIYYY